MDHWAEHTRYNKNTTFQRGLATVPFFVHLFLQVITTRYPLSGLTYIKGHNKSCAFLKMFYDKDVRLPQRMHRVRVRVCVFLTYTFFLSAGGGMAMS